MTATTVATGWYVYGVVSADVDAAVVGQQAGVGSAPVRLLRSSGLAALVGLVPLDEFDEEGLRRNLEDRAWLEEQVRAHDRVLTAALAATTLVPLRFGAVYRTEEGVRRMLELRADELEATLARLRGRVELGVKAFVRRGEVDETARAASGREYLLRKQRARQLEATADARGVELALDVYERLAALAEQARANPPQRPELSGRSERMLLNAAYLVAADEQEAFAAAVDRLRAEHEPDGIELELTGPWPPYNFAGDAAA
jgi:hypothetical protein